MQQLKVGREKACGVGATDRRVWADECEGNTLSLTKRLQVLALQTSQKLVRKGTADVRQFEHFMTRCAHPLYTTREGKNRKEKKR